MNKRCSFACEVTAQGRHSHTCMNVHMLPHGSVASATNRVFCIVVRIGRVDAGLVAHNVKRGCCAGCLANDGLNFPVREFVTTLFDLHESGIIHTAIVIFLDLGGILVPIFHGKGPASAVPVGQPAVHLACARGRMGAHADGQPRRCEAKKGMRKSLAVRVQSDLVPKETRTRNCTLHTPCTCTYV